MPTTRIVIAPGVVADEFRRSAGGDVVRPTGSSSAEILQHPRTMSAPVAGRNTAELLALPRGPSIGTRIAYRVGFVSHQGVIPLATMTTAQP